VIAARTVVRLEPSRWSERSRRWQRVAREATKQCRRAVIPPVEPPRTLGAWLEVLDARDTSALRLCLWEGEAPALATVLGDARRPREVFVLVGPEGGLDGTEVDLARSRGFAVASLGSRVMRTETAGPAVIAILQWELGDLGA
jgi:16S rRNA (uracil1498-N3)-methyltransferase